MTTPTSAQLPTGKADTEPAVAGAYLGYAPEVDKRLDTLLRDIGEHIGRLYRGENIASPAAGRDLAHASALLVHCPRCSAAPHRPCTSVRGPWRGRTKAWPHPVRVRVAL